MWFCRPALHGIARLRVCAWRVGVWFSSANGKGRKVYSFPDFEGSVSGIRGLVMCGVCCSTRSL